MKQLTGKYNGLTMSDNGVVMNNGRILKIHNKVKTHSSYVAFSHNDKTVKMLTIDLFMMTRGIIDRVPYYKDGNKNNITTENIIFMSPLEEFRKSTGYIMDVTIMHRDGLFDLLLLANGRVYSTAINKQTYTCKSLHNGITILNPVTNKDSNLSKSTIKKIVASGLKEFDLQRITT